MFASCGLVVEIPTELICFFVFAIIHFFAPLPTPTKMLGSAPWGWLGDLLGPYHGNGCALFLTWWRSQPSGSLAFWLFSV